MENELQNLNHMRDILDHMHKIGGEWYKELVAVKKENADLKKENMRLNGLEELIKERINSLHANIDEKSKLVLDKISEVHTKDIPAVQNEIVKTRNSISPLTEAKRFYEEKLDTLNKKQTELDNREKAIRQGESDLRGKQNKLSIRQGELEGWQRQLEEQKRSQDARQGQLDGWQRQLEEQKRSQDARQGQLDGWQRQLEEQKRSQDARQGQLDGLQHQLEEQKREAEFNEREQPLNDRETELSKREQSLKDRETELDSSKYAADDFCDKGFDYPYDNQEWGKSAQETSSTDTNENPPASPQSNGQDKVDLTNM